MRNALTRQQKLIFAGCYLLIIFLLLFDLKFQLSILRTPFELLFRPFQYLEMNSNKTLEYPRSFFSSAFHSEKIIADLQRKNAELKTQIAEATFLKKENELLRTEIEKGHPENIPPESSAILGHIISLDTISYLDRGRNHGVKDQDLILLNGILLGKVEETEEFFSSAEFFITSDWEVVVQTENGVKGLVSGKNGRVYFMQASSEKKVEPGEAIYTTGNVAQNVPPGLYVGEIKEILQEPSSSTQRAVIDQTISISSGSIVKIVRWN